jgi:protein-tyrosine phosphatase
MRSMKRALNRLLINMCDSIFYRLTCEGEVPRDPEKLVFVCKGNICRSVFAEHLMKAKTQGSQVMIESCGLEVERSEPSPLEACSTAKSFGLDLAGHLSKGWGCCNLAEADIILAMEFWQFRRLVELFPYKKRNIRLLRGFAPFPENLLCNINDPFGENGRTFAKCFRQIERSIANIIRKYGLLQRV